MCFLVIHKKTNIQLRWYLDNVELTGNENGIEIDEEGTIIFKSITYKQNGIYTCLSENYRGDIKRVVEVLVHGLYIKCL